jgi:3-methyladenine DNA glycosylase/8-oxoguanine DNA glycosylase
MPRQAVFTIGHSTRSLDALMALLKEHGVRTLADVRTIPRSRHNPQFNAEALKRQRRLRYVHLPQLGGLRRAKADSPNAAWRNASFRGYADYMLTPEFASGLEQLRRVEAPVAIMCAEAVPWRCHRSLIADALTARGIPVEHITGPHRASPHRLTAFARVDGTTVTYPRTQLDVKPPFNLEATVRVLQRRPTNLVDVWEDGRYLRVLSEPRALVEVTNRGTLDTPDVHLRVLRGKASPEVEAMVRRVLGLDVPAAQLDEALRGLRPPRFTGLFETFANVIPFQQVSLDAGVAVVRRLVQRFGWKLGGRWGFPKAATVADARVASLKACGLSTRKAEVLKGIARRIHDGELTEDALLALDNDTAIERLCELPGIGPWSASLVLLRGLGRLDVFPQGDAGARRIERWAKRFGPLRGYAYFVGLGRSLLKRGLISA